MPVTDLQTWANQTNDSRLPGIEADIAALEAAQTDDIQDLVYQSAIFTARLDEHHIRINAAQLDATDAIDRAIANATSIYATKIEAFTYTDNKIQGLRNDFSGNLTDWAASLTTTITADVTTNVQNTVDA